MAQSSPNGHGYIRSGRESTPSGGRPRRRQTHCEKIYRRRLRLGTSAVCSPFTCMKRNGFVSSTTEGLLRMKAITAIVATMLAVQGADDLGGYLAVALAPEDAGSFADRHAAAPHLVRPVERRLPAGDADDARAMNVDVAWRGLPARETPGGRHGRRSGESCPRSRGNSAARPHRLLRKTAASGAGCRG